MIVFTALNLKGALANFENKIYHDKVSSKREQKTRSTETVWEFKIGILTHLVAILIKNQTASFFLEISEKVLSTSFGDFSKISM